VLEKLKKDGTYVPLVMGTADQWEAATMGFQNIGADYWKGETGRANLIAGKEKFTDPQYVAIIQKNSQPGALIWDRASRRRPIPIVRNLFSLGKGAIYAAGSWDISTFRGQAKFAMGAFRRRRPPARAAATSPTTPTSRWGQLGLEEQGKTRRSSSNG